MKPGLVAHTPRKGTDEWHDLKEHLECVTKLAVQFARGFGEQQAETLGWLHDFGKINPNFQEYLQACARGESAKSEPHAIWGAAWLHALLAQKGVHWKELALAILGHHAGLSHGDEIETQFLEFQKDRSKLTAMIEYAKELGIKPRFDLPKFTSETRRELWVRMMFSCLVDADFLDTEWHFDPERRLERSKHPSLQELIDRFEPGRLTFLEKQAQEGKIASPEVQRVRDEVYAACLERAADKPGIFRLTVPTGGGKTLSSLAFALNHARENELERIIIGIPYTSIIDQTAQTLRDVLGEDGVLEHHSAISPNDDATEGQKEQRLRSKLATENWDVPVIATTTVQLFESLFARKTSKCRKLHNLARSVIVLDEVQTLPPGLLEPTLDALRTLVEDYGASVVFCTATQPAFEDVRSLKAFADVTITEIVPQYAQHFSALKRVTYERRPAPMGWGELATEIESLEKKQAMVVLNTRKDALALLEAIKGEGVYHLSTLLCSAHRRVMLEEIKKRLKANLPVKLCATQVVEAGVDISFPVVYRAMGPLERIIQAAGRCNRNDEIPGGGRVVIFDPQEFRSPRGAYLVGFEKAQIVLRDRDPNDLHEPDIARDYFRMVYDAVAHTKEGKTGREVQVARAILDFPTVAEKYKLIDDNTVSIIVPYEYQVKNPKTGKEKTLSSEQALQKWLHAPYRDNWQALQGFIVNVYQHDLKQYEHDIEEVFLKGVPVNGLYRWKSFEGYDPIKGLIGFIFDPADLTRY
jgi:CRISPR-associated endonuclease/helicase Cas3